MSSNKKILLSLILIAVVIVGGYCYITFKPHANADYVTDVSELDKLPNLETLSIPQSLADEAQELMDKGIRLALRPEGEETP